MTVAATVLVAAAMIVGSWLLVATVRSSLRSDQRSASHSVVNNALRYLQEEAARGQTLAGDIPSTPGYVVMLLDRLVTRVYFTPSDPSFAELDPDRRETLIAVPDGDGFRFDIRLQSANETMFFDV
jgi:hypothetical protein